MARQLFIRLEITSPGESSQAAEQTDSTWPGPYRASWIVVENGRPLGSLMRGDLSSAAALASNAQVVVAIPSQDVLMLDVRLPGRNKQKLRHAVPYAVEDQLIDDVEQLHFALSPPQAEQIYSVATIDIKHMEAWTRILGAAGIHAHVMIPDVLALPVQEQSWVMLSDGDKVLVRTGQYRGFVTEHGNIEVLLDAALREAKQKPRLIELSVPAENELSWPEAVADVTVVKKELSQEITSMLACGYAAAHGINLLQGEFSRRENISKHLRPWYSTAALFMVWLMWQGGLNVYQYYQLEVQNEALQGEIEQIYKRTFPKAKRVVNAPLQMRQKLKKLRKGAGQNQTSLQEMLTTAAPILQTAEGLLIKNLRYQDGRMNLELELKDLQTLDKLKEQLAQQAGWKVEIQSASTRKDKVESRMQIMSTGS